LGQGDAMRVAGLIGLLNEPIDIDIAGFAAIKASNWALRDK
jgi:hypothetical protein